MASLTHYQQCAAMSTDTNNAHLFLGERTTMASRSSSSPVDERRLALAEGFGGGHEDVDNVDYDSMLSLFVRL